MKAARCRGRISACALHVLHPSDVSAGCFCVGSTCVECWWFGGQWYCSECSYYWAIKMYSQKLDDNGTGSCEFACCHIPFLECTTEPMIPDQRPSDENPH
jgi:hypothetical protein